jgi:hypothetical protein
MGRESESVAIKIAGAFKVLREDAEMGQGFDHGRIELKNLALESRNYLFVKTGASAFMIKAVFKFIFTTGQY